MPLFDRKADLGNMIVAAIKKVANRLRSQYKNNDIYSLVIYPSSGYTSFRISYSTRSGLKKLAEKVQTLDPGLLEMLKDHPDLLQQASKHRTTKLYCEVNACEWEGAGSHSDLFSAVNDILNEEYDSLYEEGFENDEICQFFEALLTDVLLEVKSARVLQGDAFSDDVLLGVQFPDSSNADAVKRISKAVNSAAWHAKLCAGYGSDT